MPDCECLESCVFFNDQMAGMPSIAEIYKHRYCRGDFATCARYMVFSELGKSNVPPDLFPNQSMKANGILERAKAPQRTKRK